jgi:hypothetical protein
MPRAASIALFIILLVPLVNACTTETPDLPAVLFTRTPQPTATPTLPPTGTPFPTITPTPTLTPDLVATQQIESRQNDMRSYYDSGYLATLEGRFQEYDDFEVEWAQLNWYQLHPLPDLFADFYMKAHFTWSSASDGANVSGCGFIFGLQEDRKHYAVFLDRQKVLFLIDSGNGSREIKPTRGTGTVQIEEPLEADITLIVRDAYSYVLVDDQLVGEYTLSQSQPYQGRLGLTVLSGTNRDYGTRCEITDLYAWSPL